MLLLFCSGEGQPFQLLDKASVMRAVQHSDLVINLIGQDWDSRHFALEDVHVQGARNIAEACAEVGVERLIHMSALNASTSSPSRFYKTKVGLARRGWQELWAWS
jgi:NADH dehydrogenase (ubiquinone) 1 alpha subcomplex subunit 9